MTETRKLPTEEAKREAARVKRLDKMHEKAHDLIHTYRFMRREYSRMGKDFVKSLYGLVLMKAIEARELMFEDLRAGRICRDYHRLLKTMMVERRLSHDLMDYRSRGRLTHALEEKYTHNGVLSPQAADKVIEEMDLGPDMRRVFGKLRALQPISPADPGYARYEKLLEKMAFRDLPEKLYRRCRSSIEAASAPEMQKKEYRSMDVPKLQKDQFPHLASPVMQPVLGG